MSRTDEEQTRPWYRQVWFWLLMAPPLVSMFAGSSLIVVSVIHSDSMVVDDYERVGRAMNKYMARDDRAVELGITARLHVDGAGARAVLQGLDGLPENLRLQLSHPTHAERDLELELRPDSTGVFRADTNRWSPGRWYVTLAPADGEWRLVGQLTDERGELSLGIAN